MNRQRTLPNHSTLTSTMSFVPYAGPHLRQFQRGLRTAQPRQDVEVCVVTVKIAGAPRVQDQPDLPLHEHLSRKSCECRLPHLCLHCTLTHTQVISLGYSAQQAFLPFEGVVLRPFRDAGYAECSYKCTVRKGLCSCLIVCADWSMRSHSAGSTTKPSTSQNTSTTRKSKMEISTGSFLASLSPLAHPPTSQWTNTMYYIPHVESHLYA